jgi:hypothetical protein
MTLWLAIRSSTFFRAAVRVRQDGNMNPLFLTKETRTKPSVFSEVKRTTNLRMRFLPENLCLTSLEKLRLVFKMSGYGVNQDSVRIRIKQTKRMRIAQALDSSGLVRGLYSSCDGPDDPADERVNAYVEENRNAVNENNHFGWFAVL